MKPIHLIPQEEINVGKRERIISALAGSVLIADSIFRKRSLLKLGLGGFMLFRGATGFCPGYRGLSKNTAEAKSDNINIKTSVVVNRPRHEVYSFWRRLDNLPSFMEHLKSVETYNNEYSEWKAKIPGNIGTISWKSEIVKDEVNERIGWRSLEGSDIINAGNVHFEDAGESSTKVNVVFSYRLPGGTPTTMMGRMINPVFKDMVEEDIRNFKKYFETAEMKERV